MADITKCTGEGCPVKDKCYRYTETTNERQSWFVEVPGRLDSVDDKPVWKCEMYWGEQQTAILDMLTNICKGQ